jgi:integrase
VAPVLCNYPATLLLQKARELGHEWYPIWATALYTGMRSGELFALTWDKVNFERNNILVDCSWSNYDGFKSTKSGDDRLVDIAPPLLTLFKELKLQSHDRIFVLPRMPEWEDGYQAAVLKQFLIGIYLEPVRFHDLRASWATMLLNKGVFPAKVMAMGGWKDIKTMMIYMRKAGVDIKGSTSCLSLTVVPLAAHSDPFRKSEREIGGS